ncbi:hypothetical protein ZIOFF_050468 [Zingiber officinale]|uniref:Retroviral polymerase SH3-like domain-containing protein n=1 Tax=Zingiber officinale TaxID=94328 RepID=A0A8J5FGX5_ZINOF|nr:hypothetical protein ZIOFF_050468 [Zingiber officinale]
MYGEAILKKFNMLGCNPVATPLIMREKLKKEDGGEAADVTRYCSLIDNLLYLTTTRPDLMYAASMLSRFMQSSSHFHLGAAKRVLRYKLVFIGYDRKSKGYKLYNPINGEIVVSHDVEFDEDASWNWEVHEDSIDKFFPFFDEDNQGEETCQPVVPTTTPNTPSSTSSSSESSNEGSRRMRTI